jgi:predicted acetyltransferase
LLSAYLDELAVVEGVPPRPREPDGYAAYRWFDRYWTDIDRTPLGIWVDHELAGFCLLREADDCWQIAEFYVAPPYRRQGMGAAAVVEIVARCRASETHGLLEAGTLSWNEVALAFWQRQGFVTVSRTAEWSRNVVSLDHHQRAV